MAALTGLLGAPTSDEFPYPGESIYPGEYFRIVIWDNPWLLVQFTDWDSEQILDRPVLSAWKTDDTALSTVEGVGPGTSYGDMLETLGDRVRTHAPDECVAVWTFEIDPVEGYSPFVVRGTLDGDLTDPTTQVTQMKSGIEMGPC